VTRRSLLIAVAVIVLLAGVPPGLEALGASQYAMRLVLVALLYAACAVAWDLVGGLTGQVSFGHATFFGVGAYVAAILVRAGLPLAATLPLAAAAAAAYAVVWGWPCLRLRGPFFAIATIGVGEATRLFALSLESITGGATGLTLPVVGGGPMSYYLALGLAVTSLAVSWQLRRSKLGLGLSCIREDIDAAESIGIRSGWLQLQVLMISAALVGMAGAVYAGYLFYVEPGDVFAFNRSIGFILMSIIGGVNTLLGPAVGAAIFLWLEQYLAASFPSLHLGIYGALLVGVMLFEPKGLVAVLRRVGRAGRAAAGSAAP